MSIRAQLRPVLTLALPLILAELGWMSMGIVDTVMIGHMDRPVLAIAASALGQVFYNTLCWSIAGILLSLDTYLSQAHGAGEIAEANRWLQHGLVLAALLSLALIGLIAAAPLLFHHFPIDPPILAGSLVFLHALNWGTPALFLYFALRRYLQAFNHVRPIAIALVSANLINAAMNWLLIYGHSLGPIHVPAMGIYGSGLSTSISRLYLAAFMVIAVFRADRRHDYGLRRASRKLEPHRLWSLAKLGAPAGAQIFVEIAIFATVTFPSISNAEATFRALQAIGAPLTGVEPNDLLNDEHHFRFGTRGEHVDILASIGEMPFDDVWLERIDVDVAGLTVPFISKKRLMENKRQTGRHRDLVDVEDLELLPDLGEDGFIR